MVGFEFIDAYRSALGEGDSLIVVGLADLGHGFFGKIAAFVGGPLVVGVGQDGSDEADDGGFVGEDAHDAGAALEALMSSGGGLEVAEHGPVDNVGEVAFQDSHRFSAGVAVAQGAVVELSGAGVAAELDHCGAVEDGVQTSVAASVQPVPSRGAAGFAGARRDGGCAVEASEAGFGEPAHVPGLEEDLGGGPGGDSRDGREVGAALADEPGKLGSGRLVLGQHVPQHGGALLDQLQPQPDHRVGGGAGVDPRQRVDPGAYRVLPQLEAKLLGQGLDQGIEFADELD